MAGLGQVRPTRRNRLPLLGRRDDTVRLEVPGEGACGEQALRLLIARNILAARVEAVYPYAVAFTDKHGAAWTAWVEREELSASRQKVTVVFEAGLPAFPS